MLQTIVSNWADYQLLDSGDGWRLEEFAGQKIVRPDSNVLWPKSQPQAEGWLKPAARFVDGVWQLDHPLPLDWLLHFEDATFRLKLTSFRHLGIFPEQAENWRWLKEKISQSANPSQVRVLNLFAYTGAVSVVSALAGAKVCQVDASTGNNNWARENGILSGLSDQAIRLIADDVLKFVRREITRANKYDLILMDPPVFGRGPKGEIWRLEDKISVLANLVSRLLSEEPIGLLVNFYATSLYPESVARVFETHLKETNLVNKLQLSSLNLQEKYSNKVLPTGFFLRSI